MKKSYISIVIISILSVIAIVCGIRSVGKWDKITRYEWLEMLCMKKGITEYQKLEPYFGDIDEQNIYFEYVQAAVEMGIVSIDSDFFNGNDYASGEFVVLTGMKSVGEKKIQLSLNTTEAIADDDYINWAIDLGVIKRTKLNKKISKKECKEIFEKIENLYFGKFYPDDYEDVKLKEGVVELSASDYISEDDNVLIITVPDHVQSMIEKESIIILEDSNGLKFGRKVVGFKSKNEIILEKITLEEAIEYIKISDVSEVTFEDMAKYYTVKDDSYFMIPISSFQSSSIGKSTIFHIYTENENGKNLINVEITDENSGRVIKIPIKKTIEELIHETNEEGKKEVKTIEYDIDVENNSELLLEEQGTQIDIELNIDKFMVAAQFKFDNTDGVQYAEVTVDADTTFAGTLIHKDKDFKIPLGKVYVPLGKTGIVGINLNLLLVVSADGTFSFEAELPIRNSVSYAKGKGIGYFSNDLEIKNTTIEANGEFKDEFRVQPILTVLKEINILDAEIDAGVGVKALGNLYPNGQRCVDTLGYAFSLQIQMCGDEDIESVVGKMGVSGEWNVIGPENAFFQNNNHIEYLPDGTKQIVDECTYQKTETDEEQEENTISNLRHLNTYKTRYGDIVKAPSYLFNYPDNWDITYETVDEEANVYQISEEYVILSNGAGIEIEYMRFYTNRFGGPIRSYEKHEVKKVADSKFVPQKLYADDFSYKDKYIVAEIKCIASRDLHTDEDYHSVDGETIYAVVPESCIGIHDISGLGGLYEEFNFQHISYHIMWARASQGKFTPEEKKEVIEILSSFREYGWEENDSADVDPLLVALQKGDFSYFAGIYKPCGIYEEDMGGGKPINNLELKENGVVTGGGTWYSTEPYPKEKPIWVIKQEDGSYFCQVNYYDRYAQNYFIIYPEGVIGDNPYIYNDPFLTETPYIHYFQFDGGVGDIIYYKINE